MLQINNNNKKLYNIISVPELADLQEVLGTDGGG